MTAFTRRPRMSTSTSVPGALWAASTRAMASALPTAGQWVPDDFSHEQTLVLETPRGLVLLSSCCHAGADTIIREVQAAFPGRPIQAIVGGFHLYETPDQEVRALARRLRDTGVAQVLTGHCTGERGFSLLREELGAQVTQFSTGLVVEL